MRDREVERERQKERDYGTEKNNDKCEVRQTQVGTDTETVSRDKDIYVE